VDDRTNLLGMTPEDLLAWLAARGVAARPEHVRRVLVDLITHGHDGIVTDRPVPNRIRDAVAAGATWRRLRVVERVTDPVDGFTKYLFEHPDGAVSEAVRIPLHKDGRFTVCLSSQVGCAMGCDFCATGRLGLARNLEPWEIVAAFLTVRDEAPGTVTGAVFQGQGEPLHNYDAVLQAARVLSHPCGARIGSDRITISTVGLVPAIRRYTAEGHKYRLIVSLSSAVAERRARLLPVAGRFGLDELRDALVEHQRNRGGKVTVAWVVLGGVNTGADEVAALKELLGDLPAIVNVIAVNPLPDGLPPAAPGPSAGPGDTYERATAAELAAFRDGLAAVGLPTLRRYSGGQGKAAGCGMLAATRHGAQNATGRAPKDPA
jgi:23S rRNA (adenine2503-C2)-methyltransferase